MSESATEANVGPQEDGRVGVKLAHPLSPQSLASLYLPEDTKANVGDVVVVSKDQANSLIAAGYVQVDSENPAAVAALLNGTVPGVEPSATSGNAEPVEVAQMDGKALNEALDKAGLPKGGSNDEKRARLTEHFASGGSAEGDSDS